MALERETVINEFYRLAQRSNRAPEDFLPRHFYRYEIALGTVVDLQNAEHQRAVGLTENDLRRNDLSRCQAIGEAARYLGCEAILAPSAAGPGTVLAVFSDRLRAGSHVRDLDYEVWEVPPAVT